MQRIVHFHFQRFKLFFTIRALKVSQKTQYNAVITNLIKITL
jgi:hypothetical protein